MKTILLSAFLLLYGTIVSQNIAYVYFESDQSALSARAKHTLDSLSAGADIASVIIRGFSDSTGSVAHNEKLSDDRAITVRNYLENKGLKISEADGDGIKNPRATNLTEAGRALNRRSEIMITRTETTPVKKQAETPSPPIAATTASTGNLSKENLVVGKKLVLKNLNFVGGTPILLTQSEPTLKDLLRVMKENPTMEIRIEGHVCCADDMELSLERAVAVMNYLIKHGISKQRLSYAGLSNRYPLASEDTEEGRTMNRRVEITVTRL